MNALLPEAGTQRNIGTAINDRAQEKGQLIWPIAVIAVEEHYNVGTACTSQAG
ncbi:MAG: hypothetical protein WBX13_18175 [Candidatus Acidiferrales bacterium]